jgi:two-component system, chemotaxis family, CheB/CheR fusion protein
MPEKIYYNNDFYIIGIGASAGGLEALELFFNNMPAESGMAFVVVQHLSPDYKSMMVEILSKHTDMQVLHVEDGMLVQPNQVYLIPSKKNITLFHGKLYLNDKDFSRGFNLPIDIFLMSLAKDQGQKAIAVILSGTGSDGTRGIRAIKEHDGMVIVQEPESAKFDGMPNSAIATGLSDYILLPENMPTELCRFIQHPYISKPPKNLSVEQDGNTLFKILSLIREQHDIDFTDYKENTVIRRIERRMGINQIEKFTDYLRYLHRNCEELKVLYKELLIGVTNFFRDPEAFEVIEKTILPKIFEHKTANNSSVRVWVAGCSTGEEAYSIAILLAEYMQKHDIRRDVKIFATDIDKQAIELASIGLYPESIAADISPQRLHNLFVKKEDKKYQVSRQIRQMVIFAPHNLAKDPPFVKIDLVSCRNLFIYLQPRLQDKVLKYFHFSLKPYGFLFLGSSETIGDNVYLFSSVDSSKKIYQYKGGYQTTLQNLPNFKEKMLDIPAAARHDAKYERLTSIMPAEKKMSELIYEALMEEFLPACIITNENLDVLHLHGNLEAYLKFPQGQMSINLTKILRQDISMLLSTAAHNVIKHHKKLLYNLQFKVEDGNQDVNLHVQPLRLQPSEEEVKWILIVFEEIPQSLFPPGKTEPSDISNDFNTRIIDLERELQYSRETLQATIEELETSNEELQATNEELLAANEELQSTNEELQAVNEELVTVNSEYQYKIQELTALNDDFNNLLSSVNIGMLLLDKELRVKHYTTEIAQEIYIIESDMGRPIQHISHNFQSFNLLEPIHQVLEQKQKIEIEIQNQQEQWFLLRIAPYLTGNQITEGVVITLANVTDRRLKLDCQQTIVELQQRIAKLQRQLFEQQTGAAS